MKKQRSVVTKVVIALIVVASISVAGYEYYVQYNSPATIEARSLKAEAKELSKKIEVYYGNGAAKKIRLAFCDESIVKVVLVLEKEYGVSREVALYYLRDADITPSSMDPFEVENPANIARVIEEVERGDYPLFK